MKLSITSVIKMEAQTHNCKRNQLSRTTELFERKPRCTLSIYLPVIQFEYDLMPKVDGKQSILYKQ